MWGIGILLVIGIFIQILISGFSALSIVSLIVALLILLSCLPIVKKSLVGKGGELITKIVPLILIGVLLFSGVILNPYKDDNTISASYNKGMKHIVKEQYEKAEEVFDELEISYPEDTQILLAQGILYINMDNYTKAITYLRKANVNNPYDINIQFNLALAYYHSGNINGALNQFDYIIQQNPRVLRALIYSGTINMELGNYRKAIYKLEQARFLDPDSIEVQYHLGMSHFEVMNYQQAKQAFSKILQLKIDKDLETELNELIDVIDTYVGGGDDV